MEETQIFLSNIETFHPAQDQYPDKVIPDNKEITSVLLSTANDLPNTIVMLDTQSSIHLVSNSALLTDITDSTSPVTIQGITGDKVRVTLEGYIKDIGVTAYFGPHMAANILSYHSLQETHYIYYDEHEDTFSATPHIVGPVLRFGCFKGHYILNLADITQVFFSGVSLKSAKYSKRQLIAARKAYEFIIRMGFISFKTAAKIVQRGSIKSGPCERTRHLWSTSSVPARSRHPENGITSRR